ncbi:MAG: hypothetical protein AAFX05_14985 [Planctomycetota bacterium]
MTRSTMKACLFGGTLLTAGLSADVAEAASFSIGTNSHGLFATPGPYAYAYTLDGGFAYSSDTGAASGPTTAYANIVGTASSNTSSIVLSSTELTASNTKSAGTVGFNYTSTYTAFTIDTSTSVLASWSTDTGISLSNRVFRIRDTDSNTVVFDYQSLPFAQQAGGSTNLLLNAGTNYEFEHAFRSLNGNGGGTFSLQIPSPGVASLLGVAGLGALRRRR